MGRLLRTANKYATGPIGLGLSKTTGPNKVNLHAATRIWRRAAKAGPFVAWHAGEIGLLAVAMGAAGYEVGMCTGERYNVRGQQSSRVAPPAPVPATSAPTWIPIGRSLERRSVERLAAVHGVHRGDLNCLDADLLPTGFDHLARRRPPAARSPLPAARLEALDSIGARKWMLRFLSDRALEAMASARRIRVAANNTGIRIGANPAELEAMCIVTQSLMSTARVGGTGGDVA